MKLITIALTTLLGATAAQAQVYGAAAVGAAHLRADCEGQEACKTSSTGAKLLVGFVVHEHFSLQAGYLDFGKFSARDPSTSISLSSKVHAWTLGGAVTAPLDERWGWTARLGIAQVNTHVSASDGLRSGSASTTKAKAYAGLSLTCALSKAASLELGVDTTRAETIGETRASLRLVSLGISYAF